MSLRSSWAMVVVPLAAAVGCSACSGAIDGASATPAGNGKGGPPLAGGPAGPGGGKPPGSGSGTGGAPGGITPPGTMTSPGAKGPFVGPASGRRLTREEYYFTVLDLLKYDLGADRATLAPDFPSGGFRNSIDGLAPSPMRTAAFETLAGRVSSTIKWIGGLATFAACADSTPACEGGYIKKVGRLLYRRALTDAEVTNLARLFAASRMDAPAFETGARLVLEAMLQSPHFLYRPEKVSATPTGPELAVRLSYLLWKSAPTDELLSAAEQGKLGTDVSAKEVVATMLADQRARRGLREYADDWLQLYRLDARAPDPTKGVTPDLIREMREETLAFVSRIAWDEPADLMTLLTDKKSDLGPNLAKLYGLTPVGTGPKRYDFAQNPNRLGLLTQPAVLSVHAKADHASIVDRGLVVMRTFLCGESPPPPDGVVTMVVGIADSLTDREKFAIHSASPACAGCHRAFEPLGKPFEPYDFMGKYRVMDSYGNKLRADTSFDLDGTQHETPNVQEFANVLTKSPTVEDCLVRKAYQYAYGRALGANDTAQFADLGNGFRTGGRKYRALLETLTASAGFRAPAPSN